MKRSILLDGDIFLKVTKDAAETKSGTLQLEISSSNRELKKTETVVGATNTKIGKLVDKACREIKSNCTIDEEAARKIIKNTFKDYLNE
jgi:hypothetical protein